MIEDFEMKRLFWIVWMDPTCNYTCPSNRKTEGDLTHRREEDNVTMEAETGVTGSQAKECWQPLETGTGKK